MTIAITMTAIKTALTTTNVTMAYLAELVLAVEVLQHFGIILSILRVWLLIGHRQVIKDLPHLGLKAHVDHTIGLIHHHIGALI